MTPLYLILRTQTHLPNKPNYTATAVVPSGLPLPPTPAPSPFTAPLKHHVVREISHATANVTERFDIRLSWECEGQGNRNVEGEGVVEVVGSSNDKEEAGILMHEALDSFVEEATAARAGSEGIRTGWEGNEGGGVMERGDKEKQEEQVKRRIKTMYDEEYDLVFAAGMRSVEGENVCFEMFCVSIGEGLNGFGKMEKVKEEGSGRVVDGNGDVEMEDVLF